jgi:hypothetical protein
LSPTSDGPSPHPDGINNAASPGEVLMSLWSPIALIIFLSFTAAAIGVHVALVFCTSVVASYVSIIMSMGGLGGSDESRAMALGFGLMFLIPAAAVTLLAVVLGHAAKGYLAKQGFSPLEAIRPSPIADSQDDAVKVALRQFRNGSAIKIKCPLCRSRLVAKRVLSGSNKVPDIEVVCPCGVCNGVHSFYSAES